MSLLSTTADLLNDALKMAGEKTDGSSDFLADAIDLMNSFYMSLLAGGNVFDVDLSEPWSWARSQYPIVLILQPALDVSVSVTQDASSGTFALAPAASQQGRYLKVMGRPELYRIANHVAGATAFTLDSAYADTTGSGLAARCFPLDYSLPASGVLRLAGPMTVYRTQVQNKNDLGVIEMIDANVFERNYPLYKTIAQVPTAYTVYYKSSTELHIRFSSYPTERTKVEIPVIPVPAPLTNDASSIPIIPEGFRRVLSYATAAFLCLDKEDSKYADYAKLTVQQIQAMIRANRREQAATGKNRGRLIARADDFGSLGWPTSGGASGI